MAVDSPHMTRSFPTTFPRLGARLAARLLFAAAAIVACALAPVAIANEAAGDRAADRGAYDVAVREYGDALERRPDDVQVLIKMAQAKTYLASEREPQTKIALLEEAAAHAHRAAELEPENADAHFELARALGRLAEFRGIFESLDLAARVKDELDRTLELEPDHADALHALGLWHFHVPWIAGGRTGRIRPLFERAIELEPQNVSHHVTFGEILLELGEREAAREHLERAIAIEDDTFVGQQEQERAQRLLEEND